MSAKEKAPTGAATSAGAETADNMFPCAQSITGDSKRQGQILNCLPVGADRPVTAKDVAAMCGHSDQRKVSRQIEHLRRSGVPVCASCDPANPGYYRAATPGELALYLHGLRGRMREITATHNALERVLCEWEGQGRIEGW